MKKFLSLFLVVLMCMSMVLPIYAADEMINPRYNNTFSTSANFRISDSGLATATLSYIGYTDFATDATITCKIEKKFLWWWNDVDGAYWVDNVVGCDNVVQHTFQLSKTGTYRLSYEFVINGSGGSSDVISSTIENEY